MRMLSMPTITNKFEVLALERFNTLAVDAENGAFRVSSWMLRQLEGRNQFIRISRVAPNGDKASIVRIARAATRTPIALRKHQIALQYEDRRALGIRRTGEIHDIELKPIYAILGIPLLMISHPSPVIKFASILSVCLAFLGAFFGALIGVALG